MDMKKVEFPIEASYAESKYVQMSDYYQSQNSKNFPKDANLGEMVDWKSVREQNYVTKEIKESQRKAKQNK